MGYVDAQTMIEFKNKMKRKFAKKIDNNVFCKFDWYQDEVDPDNPAKNICLFNGNFPYEEGAVYSYALGQHGGHYYNEKNNKGFPYTHGDYLHYRKKYYDQRDINFTYSGKYTLYDLLLCLFDNQSASLDYFLEDFHTIIEYVQVFGNENLTAYRSTILLKFKATPEEYGSFKTDCLGFLEDYFIDSAGGSSPWKCYKGILYIVKNRFNRAEEDQPVKYFCEKVIARLSLILSIQYNSINNFIEIYISLRQ